MSTRNRSKTGRRNLNRGCNRALPRYATRMLDAARRLRPPNYLAIAFRAFEKILKIDARLRPYMEERKRLVERLYLEREIDDALQRVYGQSSPDAAKGQAEKTQNR